MHWHGGLLLFLMPTPPKTTAERSLQKWYACLSTDSSIIASSRVGVETGDLKPFDFVLSVGHCAEDRSARSGRQNAMPSLASAAAGVTGVLGLRWCLVH